ncbi:hypothetical protein [Candidatus Magnetobacterium casense]|uniref:Uncharacterized protein n=1 Tax=Candidatus Magnetobacterium casense TaxID=1455061 RepID=A0ABS6S4A6_9BACT|nr:hypothetical protein [Candidatus Magnetobacterium casensis]MBV6343435.1 hypothetical protein [Candidatus Magnetobacterium casensis]
MRLRILAVMLIVGMYLLIPVVSLAATAQVIVITASPIQGNECVTDLGMEFTLPDEVSFWWTPAQTGNGTKIVMTVGDWPQDCEDGLVVYEGNETTTSQTIDTDDLVIGLYYHVYNITEGGNCSTCYATGSVIASDSIDTGGAGNVTINTAGLDDMADIMRTGLIFGTLFILGIVGAVRHSLTGYLGGIIGLSLSLAYMQDQIGMYLVIPMIVIILGLGLALVRDAWTQGVEIF